MANTRLNVTFAGAGVPLCGAGMGSLMNIHPVATVPRSPRDLAQVDKRIRDQIFFDLAEDGIYIARRRLIALSLAVSEAEVDRMMAVVTARLPGWQGLMSL